MSEPRPPTSRTPSRAVQVVIVVLAVGVGVPVGIGAWIGGILLAENLGVRMPPEQVFAWIIAALVGVVLWPLSLRGARRGFSNATGGAPGNAAASRGERALRALIITVGAVALVALCGPRETASTVATAWEALAIGRRESGLLIQLLSLVLVAVLAAPVVLFTHRAARTLSPDDPRRRILQEREAWTLAAATAWTVSLMLGLVLAIAILLWL
ncbi:hypothetical protein [Microbacterium oleivorans]|uniref:Uncharacterized protein n=1 Tax=Microbacterium oleivorans TaxID=273677 RepID=A0A4R5YMM2_9MICO|nr:hypothetical protein [Microbacterium oleivorans]TDL45862.1 hypothetical protein E2R54_05320 [Microbacterium oleivorans]